MACPLTRTTEGFEAQFGVNHLAHFLLALRLLPALQLANGARVVAVSSVATKRSDVRWDDPNWLKTPYDKWLAYASSKTANVLFAIEFHRRFADVGITCNALHPGDPRPSAAPPPPRAQPHAQAASSPGSRKT